ncbi:hypothetical protein ACWD6R_02375 [Streptomyces sp. NPDC005151]
MLQNPAVAEPHQGRRRFVGRNGIAIVRLTAGRAYTPLLDVVRAFPVLGRPTGMLMP